MCTIWNKIKKLGKSQNVTQEVPTKQSVKGENKEIQMIQALGGLDNIVDVDACITRLRVTLKDCTRLVEESMSALGVKGIVWKKEQHVHLVMGIEAEKVARNINRQL